MRGRLLPMVRGGSVRRHDRCASGERGETRNVTISARKTSRSVRQSCTNVTFGAPIRTERERTSRTEDKRMGALLNAKRRLRPRERAAGGGWRSEGDANGAANVTFGATIVTPYSSVVWPVALSCHGVKAAHGSIAAKMWTSPG